MDRTLSVDEIYAELMDFKEKQKEKVGDYEVSVGKNLADIAIIQFQTPFRKDSVYKNKKIIKSGTEIGSMCDVCSQRLFCLVDDSWSGRNGKCYSNNELRDDVNKKVKELHQLTYPKEQVVAMLLELNFTLIASDEKLGYIFLTKKNALAYVY